MKFLPLTLLWLTLVLISGCDSKQAENSTVIEPSATPTQAAPFANQQQALDRAKAVDQTQENTIEANKQKMDAETR